MLSNYVKNLKTDIPNVIATELNFNFQLNEVIIVGSIDRLDKEDDGIIIIDYKTSKSSTKAFRKPLVLRMLDGTVCEDPQPAFFPQLVSQALA